MRSIPTLAAVFAAVLCWNVPVSVRAQYLDEPVAILCIAGMDRLLEDVQTISTASGNPALRQRVEQFLEQAGGLTGIDRTRPIAVLAYTHREDRGRPGFAVAIPVANVEQLQQALSSRLPVRLIHREGDRWVLERPGKSDPARMIRETLFVCSDENLLPRLDPAILEGIDELAGKHDLSLQVRRAGVQGTEVNRFLEEVQRLVDRESERKQGEDHRELAVRRKLVDLFDQFVRSAIQETDHLELGVTLDEGIEMTAEWRVRPEGRLSRWLVQLPLTHENALPPRESTSDVRHSAATPEEAASLRIAVHLPSDVREYLDNLITLVQGRVRSELEPRVQAEMLESVAGLFDAAQRTIATGRLEGTARFIPTASHKHMIFLARWFVSHGEGLEESLKTILPHAEKSSDVDAVKLDVIRDEELHLHLHRLIPKQFRPREQRLYGPEAAIYVGTGPSTFWFAAGGDEVLQAVTEITRRAQSSGRSPETAEVLEAETPHATLHSPPLLEVRWSTHHWLRLIERSAADAEALDEETKPQAGRIVRSHERLRWARLLRQSMPGDAQDDIRITLTSNRDGVRARIRLESGYVRFLGLLLKQTPSNGH